MDKPFDVAGGWRDGDLSGMAVAVCNTNRPYVICLMSQLAGRHQKRAMIAHSAPPVTASAPAIDPGSRHRRIDDHALATIGKTGIRDIRQATPARLLFPQGTKGDRPLIVTVTTSGGLTAGDSLLLDIAVDPGAVATVVPQAAEKLYRRPDPDSGTNDAARIETRLSIGQDGCCEWLAQEAILFDQSRMRRSLEADLAGSARMLAMEMLVLGRNAMGEPYGGGVIDDNWRIRRDGRLIWADAFHARGNFNEVGRASSGLKGTTALATLVYAGPDAAAHLDLGRSLAEAPTGYASAFEGLLVLRMTGQDPRALRRDVMRAAGVLRAAIFGVSPSMPII